MQALKNLMSVCKHFTEFVEDQFDFHSYCIRKTTLRAYIAMLRMEDTIYHADSYIKAAWLAIDVFVHLADSPNSADQVRSPLHTIHILPRFSLTKDHPDTQVNKAMQMRCTIAYALLMCISNVEASCKAEFAACTQYNLMCTQSMMTLTAPWLRLCKWQFPCHRRARGSQP